MYSQDVMMASPSISQFEPVPAGIIPPGFDPSTCRSVYVGNVHARVSEPMLADIFSTLGPLEGCKLIRKERTSYGFVNYFDHRSAAAAVMNLNGRLLYGQPIKVNWAYAGAHKEDTSTFVNIFVGDLGPEVTDAMLFTAFKAYGSCADAKVMWDHNTGRSRGYGFVSFRSQQDAESAMRDMAGKWLGSRVVRCNWATKNPTLPDSTTTPASTSAGGAPGVGAGGPAAHQSSPAHSQYLPQSLEERQEGGTQQQAQQDQPHTQAAAHLSADGSSPSASASAAVVGFSHAASGTKAGGERTGVGQVASSTASGVAASMNPQFTTVFVGNLPLETTQADLHRHFYDLGAAVGTAMGVPAGVIEEVRVRQEKGFGFVRYSTHEQAAAAIEAGNGSVFRGRQLKCSWGSKPTHPSVVSTGGLPPPPPAPLLPSSPGANPDLMAYQMTQTHQRQPPLLQQQQQQHQHQHQQQHHHQHQQFQPHELQQQQHHQFQAQLPTLHFREQHLQGGAASGAHQQASANSITGLAAPGLSGVGVSMGPMGLSAGSLVGGGLNPAMMGVGTHPVNGGMSTGMVGLTAGVLGLNAHAVGGHASLAMHTMATHGMARGAGVLPGVGAPSGGVYSGFVQGSTGSQSVSGAVGMYY